MFCFCLAASTSARQIYTRIRTSLSLFPGFFFDNACFDAPPHNQPRTPFCPPIFFLLCFQERRQLKRKKRSGYQPPLVFRFLHYYFTKMHIHLIPYIIYAIVDWTSHDHAAGAFFCSPSALEAELGGTPSVWGRFASRWSTASESEGLFLSFSALRAASFCAWRRASLSFRSFSLRSALDSNSCQSPSSFANLDYCQFLFLLWLAMKGR